jgi:beta-N-acetylhexosaminidase
MKFELEKLSLKRMIGQMVIARLNVEDYYSNMEYQQDIQSLIKIGVGGFCLFQGNKEKTKEVIKELQDYSPIPLVFSGDYEHGLTMRLEDGTSFPHAMALGKSIYPHATYEVAKALSEEISELGIHWNYAPVCDINSNKNNPIINIRAYGENPDIVNRNIKEYIQGSEEKNIISCAKHFPGHGDTQTDSHIELPIIKKSKTELLDFELIPFKKAIESKVPSIMISHIAMTEFDDNFVPASLSTKICKDLLRNEMQFEGIIITDALEMKAIANKYSTKEIALMGLDADLDVFLMPINPKELINEIFEIAKDNIEYISKIKSSVRRIFNIKEKYKVFEKREIHNTFKINLDFPKLALESALGAIDLFGNSSILPIDEDIKITSIAILQDENIDTPSLFFSMLTSAIENDINLGYIDKNISQKDIDDLVRDTFLTDLFIFPIFIRSKAYSGSVGLDKSIIDAINEIRGYKPSILVFFGNPYISENIDGDLKILCYSDSLPSMAGAVVKLSGREAGV